MLTNSDATIYSRVRNPSNGQDEWKRTYIKECWWICQTKSAITENGLKTADVLTVRITDLSVLVKKGDYIVQGKFEKEIITIKDLEGVDRYCITGANYNRFGYNPHIKVVAT